MDTCPFLHCIPEQDRGDKNNHDHQRNSTHSETTAHFIFSRGSHPRLARNLHVYRGTSVHAGSRKQLPCLILNIFLTHLLQLAGFQRNPFRSQKHVDSLRFYRDGDIKYRLTPVWQIIRKENLSAVTGCYRLGIANPVSGHQIALPEGSILKLQV